MEGLAGFSFSAIPSADFRPLSGVNFESQNKVERLPFKVRFAQGEQDMSKVVSIRHAAYNRHLPYLAEQLSQPEATDFENGVAVLLAESKLDGRPIGTMRLQTNLYRPLALESSIGLPERFNGFTLVEATRLGVVQERVGRLVTTILFKAFYMHCLNIGIDWMVITARSPMDKLYDALLMEDVFPGRGYIPMKHVGDIPHRIMALDVAAVKERWAKMGHPLYDLIYLKNHPDIDVNHHSYLPQFLHDFDYKSARDQRCGVS